MDHWRWLLLLCLPLAWLPAIGAGHIAVAATFAIPRQYQVMKFAANDDAVFASVRYRDQEDEQPKPALARWDPDGTLRWQKAMPEACQLARAGNKLALAYDDGTLDAQRGFFTLDTETGAILTETPLDGRPGFLCYYPRERLLVFIIYPQHRMQTLDGAWMEVRAYTLEGEEAWRWKADTTELAPCRMDGRLLIVCSSDARNPFLARLDPATGTMIWQRRWDRQSVEQKLAIANPIACALTSWSNATGLTLLDPATGAMQILITGQQAPVRYAKYCTAADRVYAAITLQEDKGILLQAFELPGGKLLWMNEWSHPVDCVTDPIVWSDRLAVLCRSNGAGRTELRIYSLTGVLLAIVAREFHVLEYWNDTVPMQVVGNRLYLVDTKILTAIEWKDD